MATITREALVTLLLGVKGATFVTFTAHTDTGAKAKTKDDKDETVFNPYARPIIKTSKINGCVCFWYDEGVLRRLEKEGKSADCFKKGESWHQPVFHNGHLTPLCESKKPENPKLYLRFMYVKTVDEATYVDANSNPVTFEQIKPFLKAQTDYKNQGLDKPLRFLTYDLDNISEITLNGETYTVLREEPVTIAA
jgi:hypothetical protein